MGGEGGEYACKLQQIRSGPVEEYEKSATNWFLAQLEKNKKDIALTHKTSLSEEN